MLYMGDGFGKTILKCGSAGFIIMWLYALYSIRVFEFLRILVVIISRMLSRLAPFLLL